MRLGLIGLDSSRPLRVVRYLRARAMHEHVLSVIVDEGDDLPTGLRELMPNAEVVRRPDEAIGEVDAIFDLGRRASMRRDRIAPLLLRGIHAFVDKPLALTSAEAMSLTAAARDGGAALASDSGFRLAAVGIEAPPGASIEVSGPADPRSPWGGLAFYGMHHAQVVDELGRSFEGVAVDVRKADDVIIADFESLAGDVRMRFDPAESGFSITIHGAAQPLAPPPDYLELLIDGFLAECVSPPHDEAWASRLIRPVALLQEIMSQLASLEGDRTYRPAH